MEFFGKTAIDFLKRRKFFFFFSIFLNIVGIGLAFTGTGLRLGIDFKGGTEVGVVFKNNQPTELVRASVSKAGFVNAEIKSYGAPNKFLIRVVEVEVDGKEKPAALIENANECGQWTPCFFDDVGNKATHEARAGVT